MPRTTTSAGFTARPRSRSAAPHDVVASVERVHRSPPDPRARGRAGGRASGRSCTAWPPGSASAATSATTPTACSSRWRATPTAVDAFERRLVDERPPLARIDARRGGPDRRGAGSARFRIVESHAAPAGRTFVAARRRGVRRLPPRAARPGRPPLPLPVHQLHQLRSAVHDHRAGSRTTGRTRRWRASRCVAACADRVPRPRRPAVPRPAGRVRRVRAAVVVRRGRRARSTARTPPSPPRSVRSPTARSSRSRGRAATTSRATRRRTPPSPTLRRAQGPGRQAVRGDGPRPRRRRGARRDRRRRGRAADQPAAADRARCAGGAESRCRRSSRPGNPLVGVLLPYTPVHHLLFTPVPGAGRRTVPDALVMTSGNLTDEPICYDDADAATRLGRIADAWLVHDRPIAVPCDDSVLRVVDGERAADPALARVRAAAGAAARSTTAPVIAVGGELKNTFCLASGADAWMSQHIGDMGSVETLARVRAVDAPVRRDVPASTPTWSSPTRTRATRPVGGPSERPRRPVALVQHHHAHVAAVMAEHGVADGERVIGVRVRRHRLRRPTAPIWGGEVLVAGYDGFERVAHLRYVPLPGGDAADPQAVPRRARAPVGGRHRVGRRPAAGCVPPRREERRRARSGSSSAGPCVPTSSMGRLFDAVSSLLGRPPRRLVRGAGGDRAGGARRRPMLERAACDYRFADRQADEIDADAGSASDRSHDLRRGRSARR